MFSGNWLPSDAAKGVVSALERTGDAISKGATKAAQSSRTTEKDDESPPENEDSNNKKEMMGKLKGGWSSMMEATKHAIEHTREVVEKEQTRLFTPRGPYKRDPNLPLDVDALRDAEVVYVTDRLITMSHPAMQSPVDGDITPDRKLAAVGHLLQRRHGGRYMVWNLSEVEYDISVLEDQVLTFQFPGSPSPPLGLLLKLLVSMESWLKADKRNVAVIHCLTGRGRTSTVLAAFLCWTGEAGFKDVNSALAYVARCKHISVEELTIPSQRRYVSYFANMLDGVRPSQPPLMLKRVIMSEAPKFGKGPTKPGNSQLSPDGDGGAEENALRKGCAPYLQIFKGGNLLFTTAATVKYDQDKDELPFVSVADGAISFHTERVLQGDILMRCRHLTKSGQRVSMFRAAFHTGYVPPSVLRLTKAQLDGACTDRRFPDDFFLDLIFEACDAEVASKHLQEGRKETESDTPDENKNDAEKTEGAKPEEASADSSHGPNTVTASEYDSMLHRDSRFWDVIAERNKLKAGKPADAEENDNWGPTIGRRREWDESKESKRGTKKGKQGSQKEAAEKKRPSALETFSIGEFDFLPSAGDTAEEQPQVQQEKSDPPPKERDELMEALNAIDDETGMSPDRAPKKLVEVETEEIVFDNNTDGAEDAKPSLAALPELSAANKSEDAAGQETEKEMADAEKDTAKKEDDAVAALLADADLDLDADVDAFLASAQENGGEAGDDAVNMEDLLNFDDDDDDLEDLENFLTESAK